MCLKSHVARLDPFLHDIQQPNVWSVKECYDFTMSWHNWPTLCQLWQLAKTLQILLASDRLPPKALFQSDLLSGVELLAENQLLHKNTHTFTNTHRVTNSANVRWCIKSSAGLAMPLRPGLCCQCKSRFRNLQAPVERPNSLCSGVVSCKFLHHHPGAQAVCAEGWQIDWSTPSLPPPVFRG